MKRTVIMAVGVSVSMLVASFAVCGDMCGHVDDEFIKKHLSLDSFKIESKKSIQGVCEIVLLAQNRALTLYAGREYVISGNLFAEKRNLSDQTLAAVRKRLFKKNLPLLDQSVYFTRVPTSGKKRSMYFFTDPLCAYCQRAESAIVALSEKYGVAVHVVLISVNGERSRKKCIEAKCRNIGFGEYATVAWKKAAPSEKDQCRQGMIVSKLANSVSDELLVEGVPAFYLDDGSFISGADIDSLANALEKAPSGADR